MLKILITSFRKFEAMRKNLSHYNAIALETVDFQSNDFFLALVEYINSLRSQRDLSDLHPKRFFKDERVLKISKIIKEHKKMLVNLEDGTDTGPAFGIPFINANHVFYEEWFKSMLDYFKKTEDEDVEFDATKVLKEIKKSRASGYIDLKKAQVGGFFSLLECRLLMPKKMLLGHMYKPEEVAAIILHEVGHGFTTMEYSSRVVSANQVMAAMSRILDGSLDSQQKEIAFEGCAKALGFDKIKTEALVSAKTKEEIAVIVLDSEIERSVSELGLNIYDVNACEQLADQFSARHGAGAHLVTGLDKLITEYSGYQSQFLEDLLLVIGILFIGAVTYGIGGILMGTLYVIGESRYDIYDKDHARMNRIKLQHVEQLKNPDLDPEVRKNLIKEIEVMDTIKDKYSDDLGLFGKLAHYTRPGFRADFKYEKLQKDLENIASSDLFVAAGKLKTV